MKLNADGLALIKYFEGCRLDAYLCPAGVWTIGWGHTGPGVREGLTWTQEQADGTLVSDLAYFEDGVSRLLRQGVVLPDSRFGALVSFAYNVGLKNLSDSTLLRRINEGRQSEVPAQLQRWNRAGGKVSAGLVRRRKAEALLWNGMPWAFVEDKLARKEI